MHDGKDIDIATTPPRQGPCAGGGPRLSDAARVAPSPAELPHSAAGLPPMTPATSIAVPDTALDPAFRVRPVTAADEAELGRLHDGVFGPGALTRTAYRIREGRARRSPFCRLTEKGGRIVAAIRFTPIRVGGTGGALMLGPLMVADTHANQGHARRLIRDGLTAAEAAGIALVVLVGDAPYYGRLGFRPIQPGQITMPGPVDPARLLAFELQDGAIARFRGVISADG
jgi:predicted N-acetyltransferase YhbS